MAVCPKDRPFLVGEPWINKNCQDFNIQLLSELRFLEDPDAINFPITLSVGGCEWEDNENLCKKLKSIQDLRDELQRQGKPLTRSVNAMLDNRIIDQLMSECENKKEPLCQKLEKIKDKLLKVWSEVPSSRTYVYDALSPVESINQTIKEKNDFFKTKKEIIDKYNDQCKIERKRNGLAVTVSDEPVWVANGSNLFENHVGYVEQVVEYREKIDEHNAKRQTRNLVTLASNMRREKENNATIAEFEKFYTSDKEKQLLKEYKKAVSQRCVGCEYPEPLDVSKSDCQQCSNREFVDGKCILKKDNKREGEVK